jgi:hypothetical protein
MSEDFGPNSVIIANLVNPKEKFWGILRSMNAVGITLRGISLDSFDDWVRQLARMEEEPKIDLVTMFVPLFRVERIFLDEPVGSVPSYSERFEEKVGMSPLKYLGLADLKSEDIS